MPHLCAVFGCTNRYKNGRRMFSIPNIRKHEGEATRRLSERRRREWIKAIGRKDISDKTVKVHHKVCQDHFVSGEPSYLHDDTNVDWVPTLKMGHDGEVVEKIFQRSQARKAKKRKVDTAVSLLDLSKDRFTPNTSAECEDVNEQPVGSRGDNSEEECTVKGTALLTDTLMTEMDQKDIELNRMTCEIEPLKKRFRREEWLTYLRCCGLMAEPSEEKRTDHYPKETKWQTEDSSIRRVVSAEEEQLKHSMTSNSSECNSVLVGRTNSNNSSLDLQENRPIVEPEITRAEYANSEEGIIVETTDIKKEIVDRELSAGLLEKEMMMEGTDESAENATVEDGIVVPVGREPKEENSENSERYIVLLGNEVWKVTTQNDETETETDVEDPVMQNANECLVSSNEDMGKMTRENVNEAYCASESYLQANTLNGMLEKSYVDRNSEKKCKVSRYLTAEARSIKPRCQCQLSRNRCKEVTDSDRERIFKEFGTLTWEAKKLFVKSLVQVISALGPINESAKIKFYLKPENRKIPVCREMFLNTVDLKDKTLEDWVRISRGRKIESARDCAAERKEYCRTEFFQKLAIMPACYHKLSSKKYLERVFRTKSDVYRAYLKECEKRNVETVGMGLFTQIFNEENLALFRPPKDECDICIAHDRGSVEQKTWEAHMIKIQKAEEAKSCEKQLAKTDNLLVISMDLQTVLLAPCTKTSALCNKSKLHCYNFTICNLTNQNDVEHFFWNETEGGLTPNEFATCIYSYLNSHLGYVKYILYSSEGLLNTKNDAVLRALQKFAVDNGTVVEQKFLENGHSNKECETVHAAIENSISGMEFYLPADYLDRIASASPHERYKVHYPDHSFFKDFTYVSHLSLVLQETSPDGSQISDIRCLKYLPDGSVLYKLQCDDKLWFEVPLQRADFKMEVETTPSALYAERRKISKEKFSHLQELKAAVFKDHHGFYDQIPHHQ